MSKLIDILLKEKHETFGARGFLSKPLPLYTIQEKLKRIKNAIRVLFGKSFAVHYKIDEQEFIMKMKKEGLIFNSDIGKTDNEEKVDRIIKDTLGGVFLADKYSKKVHSGDRLIK